MVGLQFILADIHLDLALGTTDNGHLAHAGHVRELRFQFVIDQIIEFGWRKVRRYAHSQNRDFVCRELVDHRTVGIVGQKRNCLLHFALGFLLCQVDAYALFQLDNDR